MPRNIFVLLIQFVLSLLFQILSQPVSTFPMVNITSFEAYFLFIHNKDQLHAVLARVVTYILSQDLGASCVSITNRACKEWVSIIAPRYELSQRFLQKQTYCQPAFLHSLFTSIGVCERTELTVEWREQKGTGKVIMDHEGCSGAIIKGLLLFYSLQN